MPHTSSFIIRRTALTALATLAGALATTAPAFAGTLSYDGDDLVYVAAVGERNDVTVHESRRYGVGAVTVGDTGAVLTYPSDHCAPIEPGWVDCDAVGGVLLSLGDGDDSSGFGVGEALLNPVVVDGGPGKDTLRGNLHAASTAALIGGPGADTLRGGPGEETLYGGDGDDTLEGGAGADQLFGEAGDDMLDGDGYADPAPDLLDGGAGTDRASGWTQPERDDHPPVSIVLDDQPGDGRPGEGDDVRSIERITSHVSGRWVLGDGDDVVDVWANLGGGASSVVAGGGNDRVTGGSYAESIDGGPGADRLEGGFGDDRLTGGPGSDQLYGDRTGAQCGLFEECTVPFGNDLIDARDGEPDSVECGPGSDRALVDAVDTVSGCEVVERVAVADAGPGAPRPTADAGAPAAARWTALRARRRGKTVVVTGALTPPAGGRAGCERPRVRLVLRDGRHRALTRKTVRASRTCRVRVAMAVRRGASARTVEVTLGAVGQTPEATAPEVVPIG